VVDVLVVVATPTTVVNVVEVDVTIVVVVPNVPPQLSHRTGHTSLIVSPGRGDATEQLSVMLEQNAGSSNPLHPIVVDVNVVVEMTVETVAVVVDRVVAVVWAVAVVVVPDVVVTVGQLLLHNLGHREATR
jgi:hypothetical protein